MNYPCCLSSSQTRVTSSNTDPEILATSAIFKPHKPLSKYRSPSQAMVTTSTLAVQWEATCPKQAVYSNIDLKVNKEDENKTKL